MCRLVGYLLHALRWWRGMASVPGRCALDRLVMKLGILCALFWDRCFVIGLMCARFRGLCIVERLFRNYCDALNELCYT